MLHLLPRLKATDLSQKSQQTGVDKIFWRLWKDQTTALLQTIDETGARHTVATVRIAPFPSSSLQ